MDSGRKLQQQVDKHDELYPAASTVDLIQVGLSKTVKEIFNNSLLNEKSVLDETAKRSYIDDFLKKEVSKSLEYTDVESLYQRIVRVPHLNDITNQPIYLLMTLYVLPFLENFYSDHELENSYEVVKRDVMHLFTADMIRLESCKIYFAADAAGATIETGSISVNECILTYARLLAKYLCSDDGTLNEISERELFSNDGKSRFSAQLAERDLNKLKKCFSNDPSIYNNEVEYNKYKIGREGCIFLNRRGEPGNFQYSFVHEVFRDYFAGLIPQVIHGRRKDIAADLRSSIRSNNSLNSTNKQFDATFYDLASSQLAKETFHLERTRVSDAEIAKILSDAEKVGPRIFTIASSDSSTVNQHIHTLDKTEGQVVSQGDVLLENLSTQFGIYAVAKGNATVRNSTAKGNSTSAGGFGTEEQIASLNALLNKLQ